MLPPTSKWVISARGRNDPFFACGATHALLARIVGLLLELVHYDEKDYHPGLAMNCPFATTIRKDGYMRFQKTTLG